MPVKRGDFVVIIDKDDDSETTYRVLNAGMGRMVNGVKSLIGVNLEEATVDEILDDAKENMEAAEADDSTPDTIRIS